MLDPLEPVLRRLLEEWPEIKAPRVTEILRDDYGYAGSVDLVRKRLAELRPRGGAAGAADGLSAGAGAAGRLGARCRRGRGSPGASGASTRWSARCRSRARRRRTSRFDMTIESFLEGHVRAFEWLGGVPRECVYDNLRSAVARRDARREVVLEPAVLCSCAATTRFHAHACTPATPREKGSVEGAVRYLKTGFWPARRFAIAARARRALRRLARPGRAAAPARDRPASSSPSGSRTSARRCGRCRRSRFDAAGRALVAGAARRLPQARRLLLPRAGARSCTQRVELRFDRDRVWIEHRGARRSPATRAATSTGVWLPAPVMRPEPPPRRRR